MISRSLLTLSLALIVFNGIAFAAYEATFLFLTIPPSPQANGMAGVYTAAGNDDPLAPLTIPGVIGLMGERHKVQAAFYPHRTNWLPQFNLSDLTYGARSLFFGFNREWIKKHVGRNIPISLGIGYYEVDLNLGETERTDAQGNPLGSFHSWENSKALGLGIGWHAKKWQAGLGLNYKLAHSNLSPFGAGAETTPAEADAFVTDFGLHFRVPFAEWFKYTREDPDRQKAFVPFFTPELGYSLLNYGGEVSYIDWAQADPLPRTGKLHIGVTTGLDVSITELPNPLRFMAFNWGRSTEDALLSRDRYGKTHYRSLLADIKPLSDLLGNSNDNVIFRTGWEIGMLETIYYREGRSEDHEGRVFADYRGHGYRASGVFKFFSTIPFIKKHSAITFVLQHLDIQYHHSIRSTKEYSHPLNNTKDEQISLSFSY